ncbi:hypothetical protein WJX84_003421 [Apatococcus fuscideae]|uniref:enoyl-[acyl-carrier-protein] reductase n=1 Tax=Apatococcus fuscideae TaxID=2026836 RepID=A0AAW1T151_9CHLO
MIRRTADRTEPSSLASTCIEPPSRSLFRPLSRSSVASQALIYDKYGAPDKTLKLRSAEPSELSPGQVRINILASPVNPSDINTIEGVYPIQPPLPAVPGNEGVGEIQAVGDQVRELKQGDWVVPLRAGLGWWRAQATFPAEDLHCVPKDIGLTAAATLTINPPTALRLLEDFVDLHPGDVVIQNGASSTVGQMVMQLAAAKGLRTVNLIRRRPQRLSDEEMADLGATLVTDVDNVKADMNAAGLPSASLALNCIGGSSSLAIAKRLRQSGTMVTYGGMSKQPVIAPTPAFIFNDLRLRGFWLSGNKTEQDKGRVAAVLDQIIRMYQNKKLIANKRQWMSLKEWQQALDPDRPSGTGFQPSKLEA